MRPLIITLLILVSCTVDKKPTADIKEFIGIWQDSPEVASGWSDTYQLFENGEFIYRYNQMICDKRTLSYSGTWDVTGDKLKITVNERTIVEGGKLVPSPEWCGSDFAIEGGEKKKVKDSNVYDIKISAITVDKDNRDLKTVTLDGKGFWKHKDDPTKY
jgi:hypothetical protein